MYSMELMDEFISLPVILVSARDRDAANYVIAELIEDEYNLANCGNPDIYLSRVWRLINKYYTADVRFHILADGEELNSQIKDLVEGHIVYLTEDEVTSSSAIELLERRTRNGKTASVRIVVAESEFEEGTLIRATATRRYELIPYRSAADPDTGEASGHERARAAFHAHVWPNMKTQKHLTLAVPDTPDDSDSESWSSWQGANEQDDDSDERWVERAEVFAAALGALPEAAAAARAERDGNRAGRLARAELVLAAFCDALGEPLNMPQDRLDREL
ncbi:unnamed protein product [Diatraea saccharalis]|uniref:Uncharacterized protein n=1 Tax=Diatraea saccharalis TaxID=40085 RepID=A0A9N9RFE9_9NEOP|nr:unnamed protein product [Diatraea saccharalis]